MIATVLITGALIPAASASAFDISSIQQNVTSLVTQYAPYVEIVKNTWDKQSFLQIIQGTYNIPDDTLNAILAEKISGSDKVKSLQLESKSNGRLNIHADTYEYGGIDISGTIDAFVHNENSSYITYTVKDKDLTDHGGIKGWLFAHLSLAMLQKIVGPIQFDEDVQTSIHGNTVTVDYRDALNKSELAQASIGGYSILDAIFITEAIPHEGYIEFHTSLQLPSDVQNLLLNALE